MEFKLDKEDKQEARRLRGNGKGASLREGFTMAAALLNVRE